MNFPFLIAKRYLVSKKKQNIINIISRVAISGVAVGTMALVIVLSVFNGFDSLVKSMFSSFDPSIKITPAAGKIFNPKTIDIESIAKIEGVACWAETLEENVILKYANKQDIATIKGVSDDYRKVTELDSLIIHGELFFKENGINYACVGVGVSLRLGVGLTFVDPIKIYAAKKGERVAVNIANALNVKYIYPSSIFSVQEGIDSKYILVPIEFARELLGADENVSAIEIKLDRSADVHKIQSSIQEIAGSLFHVKNKYQQHETINKVMNSEKWVIFLILAFILLIASFNILGSLTMLIIDKKDDISILKSMGASQALIKQIFLFEGWLISLSGAFIGLILAILVCWAQNSLEIIEFPGNGSFAVSAYPVEVHLFDIILVFITIIFIGFLVSWYPVRYISGKYIDNPNS